MGGVVEFLSSTVEGTARERKYVPNGNLFRSARHPAVSCWSVELAAMLVGNEQSSAVDQYPVGGGQLNAELIDRPATSPIVRDGAALTCEATGESIEVCADVGGFTRHPIKLEATVARPPPSPHHYSPGEVSFCMTTECQTHAYDVKAQHMLSDVRVCQE